MKRFSLLALSLPAYLCAEVHTMTLPQAVELALRQNPEVIIARLDQQKAQLAVGVARDPFAPKVYGGSGLAYISGYPNSIDGAAPSIIQVHADMALFDRPHSYQLAEAREDQRGSVFQAQSKSDEVAMRTASLYLDAEQAARGVSLARRQVESLERVRDAVGARVGEGRELPIAQRRAELDLARTQQRAGQLLADQEYAESSLAMVLGFESGDRVRAVPDSGVFASTLENVQPDSEEGAAEAALRGSPTLRSLESQLAAKGLEVRAQKAARLPVINLVAQYALFARNNYVNYFQKFQRNNGEIGVSIRVPLLIGTAANALAAQAQLDAERLRQQFNLERNRISLEARRGFQNAKTAETARSVARLDLEVARDQLSVLLSQLDEGRVTSQQVEQARFIEEERWIGFYAAESELERARLRLLGQTGSLAAVLR